MQSMRRESYMDVSIGPPTLSGVMSKKNNDTLNYQKEK